MNDIYLIQVHLVSLLLMLHLIDVTLMSLDLSHINVPCSTNSNMFDIYIIQVSIIICVIDLLILLLLYLAS